jgi:uncharacterized membrane protein YphA (DoxX/SURF4 family)
MEINFIVSLVGRILFGGYFLMNAYNHLFKSQHMIGYAQFKGVKSPKTAILGSGLLLLIGGLSFLTMTATFLGSIALLLFLIPVTFKMHAYWKETDPQAKMADRIQFYKNLALIGAVLMMFY